jgi:hypothetical protein
MARKRYHPLTLIGAVGLGWNLIGLAAMAGPLFAGDGARYAMSAAERALADLTPNWVVIGTILAVAGGIAGSAGLLMRRSWAVVALIVSLLGVVAQDVGIGLASWQAGALPGPFVLVMQSLVLLGAMALLALSLSARDARELR